MGEEIGVEFERFSPGADGGIDGRHSSAAGGKILQAKHYKNSAWSDLNRAAKREHLNLIELNPASYFLLTSQPLTPDRKANLVASLNHPSVKPANIWGLAELNDRLKKQPKVERRHIKLWLSSSAVLERIVHNDVAIFTEATEEKIARILKVYVENPSLASAAKVLEKNHSLIVSGPPGVGKTTLAQVIAAEYCDDGWDLVAISEIDQAFAVFRAEEKQVFVFDDFLGKISLDSSHLAKNEERIYRLIDAVSRQSTKRFIMTTRSYVFQAAREISDVISEDVFDINELVLDLSVYTREIKAKILYNHLYHSDLDPEALEFLVSGEFPRRIVDHKNYMPRIVEWMTDASRLQGVSSRDYPHFFLKTLENPEKIWRRAFRKHISEEARLLLRAMFFSESSSFPRPGIRIKSLQPFFVKLIENARLAGMGRSRNAIFEEAMREIKSSFAIFDGDRANFINPSVLDFLSKEVADIEVVELISMSVCRLHDAQQVWHFAKNTFKGDNEAIGRVAKAIQERIRNEDFKGRLPFYNGARLFGELLLAHTSNETIEFIRGGGLLEFIWLNEVESIKLIEDLEEGDFRALPHASGYARMLRSELYDYIARREFVIELEELADLMELISETSIEFPEDFINDLDDAVREAMDCIDPFKFDPGDDPETNLSDWLEQVEKIERVSSFGIDGSKKEEIEQALHSFQMHNESMLEEYREQNHFRTSYSSANANRGSALKAHSFSDTDLNSLFSSLKSSPK